jgi:PIN domain nuclease of toxin-antitoxin system
VRLLLDTHIALWFVLGNEKLARPARDLIADPANDVFFSIVSLLEIAIKNNLRKFGAHSIGLRMAEAQELFLADGFQSLDLRPSHLAVIEALPLHHKDPFDRLLIAQAQAERLQLMTVDRRLTEYGDAVLLV